MIRPTTKHKTKAQSLVEFALVVPLFLLLVLGLIDFSRLLFTYVSLSNATREMARVAMEQAVALAHRRADVARAVDDEEAVVVLERPARLGLRSPGRDVEIRHAFQPRHDAAGWRLLLACKILAAFVEFEP